MRFLLKKKTLGQIEFGIIYGGIALLALCASFFLPVLSLVPSCVFHGLTGFPCPTCGATRSVVYLAHGDFTASFSMNPLVALCVICAVLYFFYTLIALFFDLPRMQVLATEREKSGIRAGAILLILLNWSYLVASQ
jgi:hypothetical protein